MGGIRVLTARAPPLIERFYSTQQRSQGGSRNICPELFQWLGLFAICEPLAPGSQTPVTTLTVTVHIITNHTSKNQTLI